MARLTLRNLRKFPVFLELIKHAQISEPFVEGLGVGQGLSTFQGGCDGALLKFHGKPWWYFR